MAAKNATAIIADFISRDLGGTAVFSNYDARGRRGKNGGWPMIQPPPLFTDHAHRTLRLPGSCSWLQKPKSSAAVPGQNHRHHVRQLVISMHLAIHACEAVVRCERT